MKVALVALALLVASPFTLTGCNTYTTSRVPESGPVRGYPFVFSKPYLALVTFDDGTTSAHLLSVPTLYAVDSERALLGLTKTEFENGADGFALKTKTDLDQKAAENLTALANALKTLGVGAAGAPGAPTPIFTPDLPDKPVKSIALSDIDAAKKE